MKPNHEWEEKDLFVDPDIEVSDDGSEIIVYLETWFDVDAKFGLNILDEPDTLLYLYAYYEPSTDGLRLEYAVEKDDPYECIYSEYYPSESDAALVKRIIKEAIEKLYHQTPQEFIDAVTSRDMTME